MNRLREFRKRAGIGAIESCYKVGVSMATLMRWENGETKPTTDQLKKIASLYNLTDAELLELVTGRAS